MKLGSKLIFVEIIIIIGFLFGLISVLITNRAVINLKNIEIDSTDVIKKMENVKYQTKSILNSKFEVKILKNNLLLSISDFEESLIKLQNSPGIKIIGKKNKQEIEKAYKQWKQSYDWFFIPFLELVDQIIGNSELNNIISDRSIMLTYYEFLLYKDIPVEQINLLNELNKYHKSIEYKSEQFSNFITPLLTNFNKDVNQYITLSTLISLIINILVTFFAIIFMIVIANQIVNNIKLVESSVKKISQGDFSHMMQIRSNDEFGELSNNFNYFIRNLKTKIESELVFMTELNKTFLSNENLNTILSNIASNIAVNLKAEAAAVWLFDHKNQELIINCIIGSFPPFYPFDMISDKTPEEINTMIKNKKIKIGETIIGLSAEEKKAIFIKNINDDARFNFIKQQNNNLYNYNSLMIAPIFIAKSILGVIAVTNKKNTLFTDLDFTHFQSFIDYGALTIDNFLKYKEIMKKQYLESEMKIAANMQQKIIPQKIEIPGYECSSILLTAAEVGGDNYDYIPTENGSFIGIGDACGHGLNAGIIALMQQVAFRTSVETAVKLGYELEPYQIYEIINNILYFMENKRLNSDIYMTQNYLLFKNNEIKYSGAHQIALLYLAEKNEIIEINEFVGKVLFLALKENIVAPKPDHSIKLSKNDIIILYTDGLIEAQNHKNELYGIDRLKKVLQNNHSLPTEQLIDIIKKNVFQFIINDNQDKKPVVYNDDIAIIVIKKL